MCLFVNEDKKTDSIPLGRQEVLSSTETTQQQNNCGPGVGAVYSLRLFKLAANCMSVLRARVLFGRGVKEAGDVKLGP